MALDSCNCSQKWVVGLERNCKIGAEGNRVGELEGSCRVAVGGNNHHHGGMDPSCYGCISYFKPFE